MANFIGIDIGGMSVKLGIVTDKGQFNFRYRVVTNVEKGASGVIADIADGIKELLLLANMTIDDITAIGIGCPGSIITDEGIVTYSNNLYWENVEICKMLKTYYNVPTFVCNDANVAALGEDVFGGGKDYLYTIMITLGTGVGGGIIIEGKLFEGYKSSGAELGHMKIGDSGRVCTCGRKDCFETYSSATALMRDTREMMTAHMDSKMWDWCKGDIENVDGRTAFECQHDDIYAKEVVTNYIERLGDGITNIVNIFRPQIILIGGGVSAQGDNLLVPLREYVRGHKYGGRDSTRTLIEIAKLGNDAGIYGAAALAMSKIK